MSNDRHASTCHELDERACAFEQAILTNNAACSLASKRCIGEGEGVQCGCGEAQAACVALLAILRRQARFALHTVDEQGALPHAKAMRVQIGGLRGLHAAMAPDEPVPGRIPDIRRTVAAALDELGDLSRLPFQEIVREIAAYRQRRRLRGWE